jgi:hypothetical protein
MKLGRGGRLGSKWEKGNRKKDEKESKGAIQTERKEERYPEKSGHSGVGKFPLCSEI